MQHNMFLACCIALLMASCNAPEKKKEASQANDQTATEVNVLTPAEADEGWILLFDGKSTEGWRGFKKEGFPDYGWQVKDGTLMVEYSGTGEEGHGGDIITERRFDNFDLKLQWKISHGGNSGILIHVNELEDYEEIWHTAHEIQVLDGFGYDSIHNYTPTLSQISGGLYDLYPPRAAAAKPVGEWNQARIRFEDGHLQHWLNGTLVLDLKVGSEDYQRRFENSKFRGWEAFGSATEGHIGLQDHGEQVWYRDIKILEL